MEFPIKTGLIQSPMAICGDPAALAYTFSELAILAKVSIRRA